MTALPATSPAAARPTQHSTRALRDLAYRGLARLYRPEERLFAFCARRTAAGVHLEGRSPRYTAIVLLGLAGEPPEPVAEVLSGHTLREIADGLVGRADTSDNLGDVALIAWAAARLQHPRAEHALNRLRRLLDSAAAVETVPLAWALLALCARGSTDPAADAAAQRLLRAQRPEAGLFPHALEPSVGRWRSHVACFADQVYPIQALARYAAATDHGPAVAAANHCAERICTAMGLSGQWWWHYDVRTGRVLEHYPVYAVHQDGMAPMALFALHEAGGRDHRTEIERGLNWLAAAPELRGGTLIDPHAGFIWRKVARREPRKFVRGAQAAAARLHPALRWPATNLLFPPGVIDYECRPYHLGWLLFAWPASCAAARPAGGEVSV